MDIYLSKNDSPTKGDPSAVGFYYRGSEVVHVGLLYVEDQEEGAKFLHLLDHLTLRTGVLGDDKFWIKLGITPSQMRQLAAFCAFVSARNSDGIPYSIFYDQKRVYFSDTGDYIGSDLGEGLTCATFVMAIFETLKIPLLDTGLWPADATDEDWQTWMITEMARRSVDQPHVQKMLSHIGAARYRPADVVIASSKKAKDRPMPQAVVRRAYGTLYKRIEQLTT
ncbi:hypothetical protein [Pelagibius marinus]|uniref:hypothetical protein n=1 Tax=Pelagibius marinus TaxID=2762760 RepID=UPI0018727862|nr:hypothetical protein [Pelagibius marinus]